MLLSSSFIHNRKNWKEQKRSSRNKWINKLGYIYTVEFCSAHMEKFTHLWNMMTFKSFVQSKRHKRARTACYQWYKIQKKKKRKAKFQWKKNQWLLGSGPEQRMNARKSLQKGRRDIFGWWKYSMVWLWWWLHSNIDIFIRTHWIKYSKLTNFTICK